jgi:hypothetical protein
MRAAIIAARKNPGAPSRAAGGNIVFGLDRTNGQSKQIRATSQ